MKLTKLTSTRKERGKRNFCKSDHSRVSGYLLSLSYNSRVKIKHLATSIDFELYIDLRYEPMFFHSERKLEMNYVKNGGRMRTPSLLLLLLLSYHYHPAALTPVILWDVQFIAVRIVRECISLSLSRTFSLLYSAPNDWPEPAASRG